MNRVCRRAARGQSGGRLARRTVVGERRASPAIGAGWSFVAGVGAGFWRARAGSRSRRLGRSVLCFLRRAP
eukprot:7538933-Lingulodinium_polyedra.AAC.1